MPVRTDIIEMGNTTVEPVPAYRYPFNILAVCRLLTRENGPGNPKLMPVQIRSMEDVRNLHPYQVVELSDEHGVKRNYVIDYTLDAVSPQDLIDNTTPARLEAILEPEDPSFPHELGLLDDLAHQIAVGHCLIQAVSNGVSLDTADSKELESTEKYLVEVIDRIEKYDQPTLEN